MHQYRIFSQFYTLITRVLFAAGALLALITVAELGRVFFLLRRIHPVIGYAAAAAIAVIALLVLIRLIAIIKQYRNLNVRNLTIGNDATHKQRVALLKHLVSYGKRLAHQRLLPREDATKIRQIVHDLEDLHNHHPLNDDLDRAIATARSQMIEPALIRLDEVNHRITRSKALALIEDSYFPPAPLFTPFVVFYHLFTLVSEITEIYLARPTLLEYKRVMQDVWHVMNVGQFSRKGGYFFSGLDNVNVSPAIEELGSVFSMVWITHCVSMIAAQRCRTLHDWDIKRATEQAGAGINDCLRASCATFSEGAMPMLKKRLRRFAPPGETDVKKFSDDTAIGVARALESLQRTIGSNIYSPVSNSNSDANRATFTHGP